MLIHRSEFFILPNFIIFSLHRIRVWQACYDFPVSFTCVPLRVSIIMYVTVFVYLKEKYLAIQCKILKIASNCRFAFRVALTIAISRRDWTGCSKDQRCSHLFIMFIICLCVYICIRMHQNVTHIWWDTTTMLPNVL